MDSNRAQQKKINVHDDFVGRNVVTSGSDSLTGSGGIVIGRGTTSKVAYASGRAELGRRLATAYAQIDQRSDLPEPTKVQLRESIRRIEAEILQGEGADADVVKRELEHLSTQADEVFQTVAAAISAVNGETSPAVQSVLQAVNAEALTAHGSRFEELMKRIQQSNRPDDLKGRMRSLMNDLRTEVEGGEAGNVGAVRRILAEVSTAMPELRQPLWNWIAASEHASTPVKIVARKILAS